MYVLGGRYMTGKSHEPHVHPERERERKTKIPEKEHIAEKGRREQWTKNIELVKFSRKKSIEKIVNYTIFFVCVRIDKNIN